MNFLINRLNGRLAGLILFETLLIVGAIVAAAYVRLGLEARLLILGEELIGKAFVIAALTQLCLYYADLYDPRVVADRRAMFVKAVQALAATSMLLALLYYWVPGLVIGRGVFFIASAFVVCLVLGWRAAFEWVNRRVAPRERLLLVGTGEAAVKLARELHLRHDLGVEIVGFIDPDPARVGAPVLNPGVVGTFDDIPTVARSLAVDRIVVSLADARGRLPMDKLLEMRLDGITFDHLASVYEQYTGKIAVENLRPSWLIFASGFRKGRLRVVGKRAVDLLAAGVGLVVALPLMALIAAAIARFSPGPVFYSQRRVGQHGRVFTLFKFRTMRPDAESKTGAVWAREADDRITPVGRWLRRTRMDELPQMWNVLRGDMSFVGPRPERPEFVASLVHDIPYYGQRHIIRPGLTGWAQVSYTYGASVEDALEKLQYDLFYIKNMSLALDLYIVVKTIKIVVLRRGAK